MRIPPKKVPKLKFCAAIFDMDGVVADNMAYHTKAWEKFLQKYSPGLEIGDVSSKYGMTNSDLMSFVLSRKLTPDEVERYGEEKEQYYRELYAADMAPLPGLVDFLRELKSAGMRTVVATSAPRSNADFLLGGLKIRPFFDAVIHAGHVTRGKPEPEIYLTAASRVGCRPDACVVFEDAMAGIEAGRRAAMTVVGVATTFPPEKLTGARLVIKDFREVTVARLNELLVKKDS
jgi:beta-phosphoglucomutase family hydrolase